VQAKMENQGKQVKVGARGGFPYNSLKLVQLAYCDEFNLDSNTFFLSGKALYPITILPCPNSDLFLTHIRICSL
jgi:hypothetical protein